jgi:hypothetical protein
MFAIQCIVLIDALKIQSILSALDHMTPLTPELLKKGHVGNHTVSLVDTIFHKIREMLAV